MQKMDDTSSEESIEGLIDIGIVVTFMLLFSVALFMVPELFINSTALFLILVTSLVWVPLVWAIIAYAYVNRGRPKTATPLSDRPYTIGDNLGKSTFKSDEVLDKNTLDIYTPVRTSKQWDTVTPVYNIEEVGKYAECPYCGLNIRETFYELGGVVRCNKCGALHHKECFEYYGRKCGSPSCKLKDA